MRNRTSTFASGLALATVTGLSQIVSGDEPAAQVEEIVVWGREATRRAAQSHPSTLLDRADFASINVTTTEDLVKYEPGLVIRRRFIGDANGTMGMRGSNMFQTSRSMVFADGVPLHYLLQSRWDGAPRWTLVSASEIAQVEVLYGPYSAEYSGNAMGGVVLIESAIPQRPEFHFDSSYFVQSFDDYGFDDTMSGHKSFVSWGNKFDDLSVYLSYNRLESQSQPQTFYFGSNTSAEDAIPVRGAITGKDDRSDSRLWYGDTGIVDTTTDNYKLKLGYEWDDWEVLLNMAYEDRLSVSESPNSYVVDAGGSRVWSGRVVQEDQAFNIPAGRLGVSELQRDSLSAGLRLRGRLSDTVTVESNLNRFQVLRDETRASRSNPADPAHSLAGQVNDFGDTGWQSMDLKFTLDDLMVQGLTLVTGARHESYELNLDIYDTSDYRVGSFSGYTGRSGGKTALDALFAQLNWDLTSRWDLGLGLRWESYRSSGGYYSEDHAETPQFDLVSVPGYSSKKVSPKFSLGYQPAENWRLAWSTGKAYRFPIVEELYSQYEAYNTVSLSNPRLRPENGLHHNFMIERAIEGGFLRINYFQETVKDVIEAQSESLPGGLSVRTFIPLDKTETQGAEFIANINELWWNSFDLRFNLVYTDSEIVKNRVNPAIEGNYYPRMPLWRGNLLATWHLSAKWDAGVSLQYASDSFGRNDNTDREDGVYGAQDGYTRVGLKTTYHFDSGISLGLGVDNLTDEVAYVAHPWPGRTWYANLSYDF